jgi:hypothetical protein
MDGSSEVTSKDLETTWNSWLYVSVEHCFVGDMTMRNRRDGEGREARKRDMPVEMEWVESIIPIIYRQLNIRSMGIRDRVRLMSIYSGIERIVAHSKGSEERWGFGFSVCPIHQHLAPFRSGDGIQSRRHEGWEGPSRRKECIRMPLSAVHWTRYITTTWDVGGRMTMKWCDVEIPWYSTASFQVARFKVRWGCKRS